MKRKRIGRPGWASNKLVRRPIKKIRATIPVAERHAIQVVELTEGATKSLIDTVGGFAKFGIRGAADIGDKALAIGEEMGGVVTTSIVEIPVDLVYSSLQEAQAAARTIQREIRKHY